MFNLLSTSEPLAQIADTLPSGHTRLSISDSVQGTADTIKEMQKLCGAAKRDIRVRKVVGDILHGNVQGIPACTNKDYRCYLKNIYEFFRTQIFYTYDPTMVEYVEAPALLLKTRIGDCDSMVTAMCAMFEQIGFDAQYVTIKADPARPGEFSHVYARVNLPGTGWIVCDPTMPKKFFGWEPEGNYPKQYWPASTDDLEMTLDTSDSVQMSGLGCGGDCGCKKCSDGNVHGMGAYMTFNGGTAKLSKQLPAGARVLPPAPRAQRPQQHFVRQPLHASSMRPTMAIPRGHQMRGLGAADPGTIQTITSILNGDMLNQIRALKDQYERQASDIDNLKATLTVMRPGPERDQASASIDKAEDSLRQQFVSYRTLRDKYNDFVTTYKPYFLGAWDPGLAGLGDMSLAPAVTAAIVIAGIVAAALLASQLVSLMAAMHGQSVATEGWISQARGAIQATGTTIEQAGNAYVKFAAVAAVGFLGYLLYQNKSTIMRKLKRG